jgi:small conductance mechanosensitive channel
VSVDGVTVFRVAALASPRPGGVSVQQRQLAVQGAILQVLAVDSEHGTTTYDPKTLRVEAVESGSEWLVAVRDALHPQPLPIATVTVEDAQLAGTTRPVLAQQWQQALQPVLVSALQRRQPGEISANLNAAVRWALVLVAITLLAIGASLLLRKRSQLVAELLLWVLALAWVAAIMATLLLFPQTVLLGQFALRAAGRVAVIWIVAFLLDRAIGMAIDRSAHLFARSKTNTIHRARSLLRAPTISRVINGFKSFIIYFTAVLGTLSALAIPVASVVTIGGIAALAIGFAAQTLVRDCLNGMLVLLEDQYVVGDYVMIGEYNGIVEALTVRVVQIRDGAGNLITVPHSSVVQVSNASRTWSRIDYRVAIDAKSDVPAALTTLREAVEALAEEEQWKSAFIEPVETIGVDLLSRVGIVLRLVVRTAPLRQFELRRALNVRVLERFAAVGIALGADPTLPAQPLPASPDPT